MMCLQSSRLEARQSATRETILFEDQDRTLWDQSLINRSNYFLIKSIEDKVISRYHLEAGIVYWHKTESQQKWKYILDLYDELLLIEYAPITALNRTFAFAKVYGSENAIAVLEKRDLVRNEYYYMLLGNLYATSDIPRAVRHYQLALELSKSANEKEMIEKQIKNLSKP